MADYVFGLYVEILWALLAFPKHTSMKLQNSRLNSFKNNFFDPAGMRTLH